MARRDFLRLNGKIRRADERAKAMDQRRFDQRNTDLSMVTRSHASQ